jgi:hypothetical protein
LVAPGRSWFLIFIGVYRRSSAANLFLILGVALVRVFPCVSVAAVFLTLSVFICVYLWLKGFDL